MSTVQVRRAGQRLEAVWSYLIISPVLCPFASKPWPLRLDGRRLHLADAALARDAPTGGSAIILSVVSNSVNDVGGTCSCSPAWLTSRRRPPGAVETQLCPVGGDGQPGGRNRIHTLARHQVGRVRTSSPNVTWCTWKATLPTYAMASTGGRYYC